MNQDVMLRIGKAVDEAENLDMLSAKELAELSYTSQATISRYIKLIGFSNFFEFKMVRKAQRERKACQSKQFSNDWTQKLSEFVIAAETSMPAFDSLFNTNDKVYIWCKREYMSVVTSFTNLMAREGYSVIVIDEHYDIEELVKKNVTLITVGRIPQRLYNSNLRYVSIVYSNQEESQPNVEYVKVMPIEYYKYDTLNINFRLTCMQLMFGMICDYFCNAENL